MSEHNPKLKLVSHIFLWGIVAIPLALVVYTITDMACYVASALSASYP